MPQRKAEGVTVGFLGTGAMDIDTATDLIEEYIEATISSDEDPVTFIFPLTTDEFSDTLDELVEMAQKSDITYEVITSTADKGRRRFTEISNKAAKTYHVADIYLQMEQILSEAPKAVLEVLWDKEREDDLGEIIGRFVDAEIDVKDLTDGNAPMADEVEEGEAGEVTAAVAEAEEAEEEEGEAETLPIYARSDLEKMSRADVKEIALKLNLPPRKSSAAMIDEIMEAQSEDQGEQEETEVVVAVAAEAPALNGSAAEDFLVAFQGVLDDFGNRFMTGLDEFITKLSTATEGAVFNVTPEAPLDVADQPKPRRKLVREGR